MFESAHKGSKMSRKKKMNICGVTIFALFLLIVVVYKVIETKRMFIGSQKTATELAEAFATGDSSVVNAWAQGEYTDAWDGQYYLIANSHDSGAIVASCGPDGIARTHDDIRSDTIRVTRPNRIIVLKPEVQDEPGRWDKVKGFFSRDKEVPDGSDIRDD